MDIYILSGPIHSGKTTGLMNYIKGAKNVSGILTPVIEGRRVFMNVASGEIFPMEADGNEQPVLKVGRYVFSKTAFDKAEKILSDALEMNKGWLIIDEVGPMELRGEGFHDILKKILDGGSEELNVVLVIRESLVGEVKKFFGIEKTINLIID